MDEWIYFLKNEQIKDNFSAKGLAQAKETLDVLKMDAAERWAYEQHQNQRHREASLYQSTYVLGEIKAKKETARNLKKLGVDVNTIAQATGLSIAEIDTL
ncbi:hypothetical protein [Candidatus Venteria ishoeyi]|uniref:PD-(D/E)XK nuclease family transposase n=1 Tax=Candidatus Venteria ishoeyi TaxID=1899563 RepID=A0A1H6F2Q9_9GAMM|nr:hypothetical protein [Candidatus Venteria ishoeyi]SEH04352.1 PD-(D/E)XK nuclease family transposase [Candidatus Venteria ishoeyi]